MHQDAARIAGLALGHYWANGTQGTPAEIAATIMRTGQVRDGETLWWDVEPWENPSGRLWTPDQVIAARDALAAAGHPVEEQGIYLNQDLANNGGYLRTGLKLWLAYYTDGAAVLVRGGWRSSQVQLWQFTENGIPATRAVHDDDLDVNRGPAGVWDVWELQEALNAAMPDLQPLLVDGDYRAATTSRVRVWQTRERLHVDGNAGPQTLATLTRPGLEGQ